MADSGWTLGPDGLVLANAVRFSFQRYECPKSGRHESPPSSLGALPVGATAQGELLVPLGDEEALWIGLDACGAAPVRVWIAVGMDDLRVLNALSGHPWEADPHTHLITPPAYACDGIMLDGHSKLSFFRRAPLPDCPCCRHLRFEADWASASAPSVSRPIRAHVSLVDCGTFCTRTGQAAPPALQTLTRYTGWRLP